MNEQIHISGDPTCPNCGDSDHFYRSMVKNDLGVFEIGQGFHCLECGHEADDDGVIITVGQPQPNFKPPKIPKDPAYLARVRELPCCICVAFGMEQKSPTTAHHPIHGRYSGRKRPDREAISLCDGHHQGTFDTSKLAIHRAPEQWREAYGPDTDYIAITQDALEG